MSITACLLGLLFYFMVLRELPHNDDVTGNYISFLLNFAVPPEPGQPILMTSTSFWAITESKIITVLYIFYIVLSAISIITGSISFIKKEPTRKHAGAIAISTILVLYAYNLSWVLRWN